MSDKNALGAVAEFIAASTDGNSIPADGKTKGLIVNASVDPRVVTVTVPDSGEGIAVSDLAVTEAGVEGGAGVYVMTLAAGTAREFGPFRPDTFGSSVSFEFDEIADAGYYVIHNP
jgi:hypothetical protein